MKAEEARKMTNKNIDKRMRKIYSQIKCTAKRGNSHIFISAYKMNDAVASRLKSGGYNVEADKIGLMDYYITW